jgi:ABC-type nickel/cobalt efflux system permease component RcnA
MAHLVSSIAVVVVYVLLRNYFDFTAPWLKYVGTGILLVIAVRLWLEKTSGLEDQHDHLHADQQETEHDHKHEHAGDEIHTHTHKHGAMATMSLWGLASFAFILGFAHEEEFALLALTAGGVNAWLMMIIYGLAVLTGLVIVTVACVKLFSYFQSRLIRYEKYVPKISAIIVLLMAVIIAIG